MQMHSKTNQGILEFGMELNNKDTEALVITMEECGELVQACSKVIRSAGKKKYLENLQDEAGDVFCLLQVLVNRGLISEAELHNRKMQKIGKLKKWSKLFDEA